MTHKTRPQLLLAAFALTAPLGAAAQESAAVQLSGQVRLRGEFDDRTVGESSDAAVLSRIRLAAAVKPEPWVGAFVQLQDARAWGTETNTLTDASADQLDLHQGYVELGTTAAAILARLGRQEVVLADERLVGAVGWTNTGRSFDGAHLTLERGGVRARLFGFTIAERDALLPTGLDPQQNVTGQVDGMLTGAFVERGLGGVALEVTALYDRDAVTDESYTINLRALAPGGRWLWEAAAAYQFGPQRAAVFASGRIARTLGAVTAGVGADYLSGDDDPASGRRTAFNTLYTTGHKFYGWMDYMVSFPAATGDRGLVDAIAQVTWRPARWRVRADLHRFALAADRGGASLLGWELDLDASRPLARSTRIDLGASLFSAGDAAPVVLPAFAAGTGTTAWAWAQLTVTF